jgi:glycosyltransferase involved in cell wall biosynthesis
MKILIVSFYFRPDLSAGSFRTTALVAALQARAPPGTTIHVVTTLPNRYATYTSAAPETETSGDVEITRVRLPAHRSDMRGQARAFLTFARAVDRIVRDRNYDVLFATSSRLMTAALGSWIARRKKLPLYLDIRDIFVETIGDVLASKLAVIPIGLAFSAIERWTVRRANRVNLVSKGFEPYFRERYPGQEFSFHTNGIDDEFLVDGAARPDRTVDPVPLILYAGNLGESQAMHHVLPPLASALQGRARFLVIGDGGRRQLLEAGLIRAGVTNVELRTPVPRALLIDEYRRADVLFLHLGDQPAFERVLPSKLFEYGAIGKPILAGVGGYAARFVREEIDNAAVFPPCDSAAGVKAFERLELRDTPRPGFISRHRRAVIAGSLADEILALGAARGGR